MSRVHHIHSVVFYAPGVLVDTEGQALAGMPAVLRELHSSGLELRAVCPDEAVAAHVAGAYADHAVPSSVVADPGGPHGVLIDELLRRGVLDRASTLFIDHHPRRCMAAVRHDIHAGIFEDSPRLFRDLGLWGLVPLIHSLADVKVRLGL
jgi:hypothetical protein